MATPRSAGLIALTIISAAALAAPTNFKIVSNATIKSLASVESVTQAETILGKTGAVSGSISFDPKKGSGGGTVSIDVTSIDTGIALRNDHMKSDQWLDSARFPTISFKAKKVQKTGGDSYNVTGDFTLHGVTKSITTPVTLKYVAASAASKGAGFKGDAIQLSVKFTIKLSDYGIKIPEKAANKVNDQVTISLSAVGDSK